MRGAGYVLKPAELTCHGRWSPRSLTSRLVAHRRRAGRWSAVLIGAVTAVAMHACLSRAARRARSTTRPSAPTGDSRPAPGHGAGPAARGDSGPATAPPVADARGQGPGTLAAVFDAGGDGRRSCSPSQRQPQPLSAAAARPRCGRAGRRRRPRGGPARRSAPTGCRRSAAAPAATVVAGLPTHDVDDTVNSLVGCETLLLAAGRAAGRGRRARCVVRRQLRPLREVAATAARGRRAAAGRAARSASTDRVPDGSPTSAPRSARSARPSTPCSAHVENALDARHRSEQQVRQFVADASHELRTPLATIRGLRRADPSYAPDDPVQLDAAR